MNGTEARSFSASKSESESESRGSLLFLLVIQIEYSIRLKHIRCHFLLVALDPITCATR